MGIKLAVLAALGISESHEASSISALNAAIARLDEREVIRHATALKLSAPELAAIEEAMRRIKNTLDQPNRIPALLRTLPHMAKALSAELECELELRRIANARTHVWRRGVPVGLRSEFRPSKMEIPAYRFETTLEMFQQLKASPYYGGAASAEIVAAEKAYLEKYTPVSALDQELVRITG